MKRLNGALTPEEAATLSSWIDASERSSIILNEVLSEQEVMNRLLQEVQDQQEVVGERLLERIKNERGLEKEFYNERPANEPLRISAIRRWWAAAAIILALATGTYLWINHQQTIESAPTAVAFTDINSGKEGATLTLADGSQMVLDDLSNGVISTQKNARIVLQNGQLSYDAHAGNKAESEFNIMSTPKGRQFRLLLPDDTKVWLNAGSSIRFPTTFTGNKRIVEITGEVYFEVAKKTDRRNQTLSADGALTSSANIPFIVITPKQTIEVLGTQFNVNTYEEEGVETTTLLEGSVKVMPHRDPLTTGETILTPGQQAILSASGSIRTYHSVDLEKVMAWKNGLFSFKSADLKTVMRELARWYDLEVSYEGDVPDRKFTGEIGRNLSLRQVLDGLGQSRIHYTIEGKNRIKILPNKE